MLFPTLIALVSASVPMPIKRHDRSQGTLLCLHLGNEAASMDHCDQLYFLAGDRGSHGAILLFLECE